MRTKKKIVVIINTVTPYQIDFFENLKKKTDLKVFFYSRNYTNYKFNFKEKKYHIFLDKKKNPLKTILSEINKFSPQLIIFGGYRLKYSSNIITFLKKKKINYFYWLENLNKKNYLKFKIVRFLIKKKIEKSNGVLSVGNVAKKLYSKNCNNVINFPYSIKINKINKKLFYHNKKINFLFVGQLIKRKGLHYLVEAVKKLSEFEKSKITLNIVGDGILIKSLESFLLKNPFVKYHGFLFDKKLYKLYEKSDVLIFPSIFDGWGVVPMEAMARSLSLIISKNSGVTEILKNGINGLIIKPNSKELLRAIRKYIQDPKMIKKQGYRNKKLILKSICNVENSTDLLIKEISKL